jgi:hypothetical protein
MAAAMAPCVTALAAPPKVDVNSVPRAFPADLNVSNSVHNLSRTDGQHISNNATDQVCVFCHTPHFSSAATNAADAPLWNRNISSAVYTPYSSGTMDTTPGQPDGGSIACLSCHDGTISLDSLINAPGRGGVNGYTLGGNENAVFTNDPTFTLGWTFTDDGAPLASPATLVSLGEPSLVVGTDLSGDHPISMSYPTPAQDPAFNQPPGTPGGPRMFPNGIRTFAADKVQCGSCHEPHLDNASEISKGLAPLLRVSNTQSAMCFTCHIK